MLNICCARSLAQDTLTIVTAAPDQKALALRALAHPVRWQLIDLIGSELTATATRCAEVLGESVASCSYHLGILAKYGYIELVPDRQGREKPWRLTTIEQHLDSRGLDDEGALAAEAATEVFLDHELARMKQRLRRLGVEPEPWRDASRLAGSTTWMTAGELHEVSQQLLALIASYRDRATDTAARPAGSREVRLFVATSVAPPTLPPRGAPDA
jgi:DNA-binding MarR family transcriptional regulator